MRSFSHLRTLASNSTKRNRFYSKHVSKDLQPILRPKSYKYPPFYDPYGPRPLPSEKILQLADRIALLSPEELTQLRPALQHRLKHPKLQNVSSEGLNVGLPQASLDLDKVNEKAVEKTAFDVRLERYDTAAKIKVIKEVRTFTDLGLKEAKELVEKAPIVLKQGVTREEANMIIEKIKAAGGVALME